MVTLSSERKIRAGFKHGPQTSRVPVEQSQRRMEEGPVPGPSVSARAGQAGCQWREEQKETRRGGWGPAMGLGALWRPV